MNDPYASHLPTLEFVLALVKPKKVLELGAGLYSTKAFLECPTTQHVTSIETNVEWADRVEDELNDERLDMQLVNDTIEALPDHLTEYDLLFVDNADNAVDRNRTIETVFAQPYPVTVVHDAEVYGSAIATSNHRLTFNSLLPWTAVCW